MHQALDGAYPAPSQNPTHFNYFLSKTLRRYREESGLTLAAVAKSLGWSHGKVGHWESRENPINPDDLRSLLPLYGKTDPEMIDNYVAAARIAKSPTWWDKAGGLPDYFRLYFGLEGAADVIRVWCPGLLTGPLQTRAYASAVLKTGKASSPTFEDRLRQRLLRRRIFTRAHEPVHIRAVLDESVFHRLVGGPASLRHQMRYLARVNATVPTISVQVLPFSVGSHPGQAGGFNHLSFKPFDLVGHEDTGEDLGVLYTEDLMGGRYYHTPDEIKPKLALFGELSALALSPERTSAWLEERARYIQ